MRAQTRRLAPTRLAMMLCTLVVGATLAWSARGQSLSPAAEATPQREAVQQRDPARMRLSSAQVQQAFQHIDTNHDGSLSRTEVSVFPRIERHFERIDINHDGVVSPAEFDQALQQAS